MKVCILGGGPAGMSCGLWLHLFGYAVTVLDKDAALGGAQRLSAHPNPWVLGMPNETGKSLTARMVGHFESAGVRSETGVRITALQPGADAVKVTFSQGDRTDCLDADCLVLATGARPRSTPALTELARRSSRVMIGAAPLEVKKLRDQRVAIMGGGDNAMENAMQLARHMNSVTVIARNDFVARREFIEQCTRAASVDLRPRSVPSRYTLRDDAIELELDGATMLFDYLIVLYGYMPNTGFLKTLCPDVAFRRDAHGYLTVDAWQRTNVPRVYAIGEVTHIQPPSVLTAIAQGAVAAKAIDRRAHGIDGGVWSAQPGIEEAG